MAYANSTPETNPAQPVASPPSYLPTSGFQSPFIMNPAGPTYGPVTPPSGYTPPILKPAPVGAVVTSAAGQAAFDNNSQKTTTLVQNLGSQQAPKSGQYGSPTTGYFNTYEEATAAAEKALAIPKPNPGTTPPPTETKSTTTPSTTPTTTSTTNTPQGPDFANVQIDQQTQSYINQMEQLRATASASSNALIASIQQRYAQRAEDMKNTNKAYMAGAVNQGIVSGRARYAAEMQSNILSNEESMGMRRISDLEAEKVSLIIQAEQAKNADDFKMLQAISDKYESAHDKQISLLQKQFDNSMKLEEFGMDKADRARKNASEDLKALSFVSANEVPPEKLSELDDQMGMPSGFSEKYLAAARTAQQVESRESAMKANKAYIDLLKEIPEGQVVDFPDGSTMKGMGSTQDLHTFEKEDANGRVTIVSFNKATGELKTFNAGAIGTPSNTGTGTGEGTAAERLASALARYSSTFVPGAKLDDGTPILDYNNKMTPLAWQEAIHDAPVYGLSRENFIKQFGYLLYADKNGISPSYGLTPNEQKLISGVLPE